MAIQASTVNTIFWGILVFGGYYIITNRKKNRSIPKNKPRAAQPHVPKMIDNGKSPAEKFALVLAEQARLSTVPEMSYEKLNEGVFISQVNNR